MGQLCRVGTRGMLQLGSCLAVLLLLFTFLTFMPLCEAVHARVAMVIILTMSPLSGVLEHSPRARAVVLFMLLTPAVHAGVVLHRITDAGMSHITLNEAFFRLSLAAAAAAVVWVVGAANERKRGRRHMEPPSDQGTCPHAARCTSARTSARPHVRACVDMPSAMYAASWEDG